MSSVAAYSQIVDAVVPHAAWDEAYFSLLSLKMHLQSLPGWQGFDFWAKNLTNGDVKLVVVTNWDYPDQLALWLKNGMTVDALLKALDPPARSVHVDLYEEIA